MRGETVQHWHTTKTRFFLHPPINIPFNFFRVLNWIFHFVFRFFIFINRFFFLCGALYM